MMSDNKMNPMPDQRSPGITSSAPCAGLPGHIGDKLATGRKKRIWTRNDNVALMKSYYLSQPKERGYMRRMKALWNERQPDSNLTEKQLVAQRTNIIKKI